MNSETHACFPTRPKSIWSFGVGQHPSWALAVFAAAVAPLWLEWLFPASSSPFGLCFCCVLPPSRGFGPLTLQTLSLITVHNKGLRAPREDFHSLCSSHTFLLPPLPARSLHPHHLPLISSSSSLDSPECSIIIPFFSSCFVCPCCLLKGSFRRLLVPGCGEWTAA